MGGSRLFNGSWSGAATPTWGPPNDELHLMAGSGAQQVAQGLVAQGLVAGTHLPPQQKYIYCFWGETAAQMLSQHGCKRATPPLI